MDAWYCDMVSKVSADKGQYQRTLKPKFKHRATTRAMHTMMGPTILSRSFPLLSLIMRLRTMYIHQPHVPANTATNV